MLLGALADVSISWSWKGFLGDHSLFSHHQRQQQETVHSLLLSAGDEEESDKAPLILL